MHRAAITFCRLQGSYELIDLAPEQLAAGIERIKQEGYSGFNVTVPHKKSVMAFMDELTPEAQRVQAVNTVRMEAAGKLVGHNTDTGGFVSALQACLGAEAAQGTACLIGSGGAARAGLWGLHRFGFRKIVLVARNHDAALEMRNDFQRALADDAPESLVLLSKLDNVGGVITDDLRLVVNTTPIGVADLVVPEWYADLLRSVVNVSPSATFYDMVYARSDAHTLLQQLANEAGLVSFNGLQMLIGQASLAFQFWTGVEVSTTVMASGLQAEQSAGC